MEKEKTLIISMQSIGELNPQVGLNKLLKHGVRYTETSSAQVSL